MLIALVGALAFTACASEEEVRRLDVRDRSLWRAPDAMSRDESIAKNMKLLRGDAYGSVEATLRWQCAQNLGVLRAYEAFDLLWERSLGPSPDSAAAVRRECIIALAKMDWRERIRAGDVEALQRWRELVAALKSHLRRQYSTSTGSSGGLISFEDDNLVLMTMLDTLITLGLPQGYDPDAPDASEGELGRADIAGELLEVARSANEGSSLATMPFSQSVGDGLFEGAIAGVFTLLGYTPSQAAEARLGWVPRTGSDSFSPRPWEPQNLPKAGALPSDRTSLGLSRSRLIEWLRIQIRDAPFDLS